MKSKVTLTIAVILITALMIGCAQLGTVKQVAKEVGPRTLTGLNVTRDAKQMSGVPISVAKLAVGESVVLYARGSDNGKWFELPADVVVNWKADSELEVNPTTGHVVTVKVVSPISAVAFVTATTTTKDGKKLEAELQITHK